MKAKCTLQAMMKVIKRNLAINLDELNPEQNLILAIISGGISDLLDKTYRNRAITFFHHELFNTYCDLIGLNTDITRQLLVQGGFLVAKP